MCDGLDSKTAAMAETPQAACPYLPPEIWNRIFFYNTGHTSLWSVGRKVCSTWRSEIPEVFVKKYLENEDMVQVYFLSNSSLKMVFDRYEEGPLFVRSCSGPVGWCC
jgi:hypothetical protein